MNALPLVARELRIRARQKTTYWTRCAIGGLAMMAAAGEMMTSANATNPNLVGQATFRMVSWLGFLLACGCALVTADALSRERREGTLGLLLLTKLKGYDVVLGKLCASGLMASFALFGILPALGIVVLAGGVSRGQFERTALALLNAIFLFLVVGTWISSRSESADSGRSRGVDFVDRGIRMAELAANRMERQTAKTEMATVGGARGAGDGSGAKNDAE
jgi:ABC-type transport system involved in cytochrome c biogenesis permease component